MAESVRRIAILTFTVVLAGALVAGTSTPSLPLANLLSPKTDGVTTEATALVDAPADAANAPLGLPATVEDAPNVVFEDVNYAHFNGSWRKKGETKWRIIDGTGNCCENYLSITKQGMLLDFGGDYIMFSVDEGASWRRVVPADPLPNFGEGTITVAPNGDIIGVAWNPYYGDRVVPFKYSVEDEGWFYTNTKLHQPFFDRQSVAVVPGPFNWQGQEFPYLTILRGGYPFKTPTLYSFDGLNYFVPSARFLDVITEVSDKPLKVKPNPMLDWIQPAEQSGITPVGKGVALDRTSGFDPRVEGGEDAQFSRLNPDNLRWHLYEFPSGPLPDRGVLRVDSKGTLHYVYPWRIEEADRGFVYLMSTDGGKTWAKKKVEIPRGFEVVQLETAMNGGLGIGAVAVQGRNDDAGTNQDWVYKFGTANGRPQLKTIYQVGDGKGDYGIGVAASGNRFDFATMVILPDGRLALSIASSTKNRPNLALQLKR